MNVKEFDEMAEWIYAFADNELPVLARSNKTGMVYELGKYRKAHVTEEMVVMGCKHPVGTEYLLLELD